MPGDTSWVDKTTDQFKARVNWLLASVIANQGASTTIASMRKAVKVRFKCKPAEAEAVTQQAAAEICASLIVRQIPSLDIQRQLSTRFGVGARQVRNIQRAARRIIQKYSQRTIEEDRAALREFYKGIMSADPKKDERNISAADRINAAKAMAALDGLNKDSGAFGGVMLGSHNWLTHITQIVTTNDETPVVDGDFIQKKLIEAGYKSNGEANGNGHADVIDVEAKEPGPDELDDGPGEVADDLPAEPKKGDEWEDEEGDWGQG